MSALCGCHRSIPSEIYVSDWWRYDTIAFGHARLLRHTLLICTHHAYCTTPSQEFTIIYVLYERLWRGVWRLISNAIYETSETRPFYELEWKGEQFLSVSGVRIVVHTQKGILYFKFKLAYSLCKRFNFTNYTNLLYLSCVLAALFLQNNYISHRLKLVTICGHKETVRCYYTQMATSTIVCCTSHSDMSMPLFGRLEFLLQCQ